MSVNSYLTNLASNLIIGEIEDISIDRSIENLKRKLTLYFGNEIEEQFCFGSYTRNTILPRKADENSDIDYMIVFKNDNMYKPDTYYRKLKAFAQKYYHSSEIHRSTPTIVLNLNHIKFELVPAFRESSFFYDKSYKIPAPTSQYLTWIDTDPIGFKSKITEKNSCEKSLIKPVVRLLKYWNVRNGKIYTSYELENYIVEKSYWGESMLKDYFYSAVLSLPTYRLSYTKRTKVEALQMKVREIKEKEIYFGNLTYVEQEIAKLLPNTF